jgi:hypothetical protein
MTRTQQRRDMIAREAREFYDRQDFPESLTHPKNEHNTVASYGVVWLDSRGRRTGNSWTSLAKAIQCRDSHVADGTLCYTYTSYFAGFIF